MSRAWIECSRENLEHNLQVIRNTLWDGCEIMPAIKANAYGHGLIETASELQRLNMKSFCVACLSEAIALREHGFNQDILILGYTPIDQAVLLRRYDLIQTAVDLDYAKALNALKLHIKIHIKVDTGMHRLGERAENIERIEQIYECKDLRILGIYSHICANDLHRKADIAYARHQVELFDDVIRQLTKKGYDVKKVHIQSSYSCFMFSNCHYDYARIGAAMYGVLANREDSMLLAPSLKPVLSLKAKIACVRTLRQGEAAGYDLQFTAEKTSRLATVAIGYVDGIPRSLSCGKGRVLVHGICCPIVGRICMDQLLADISEVPDEVYDGEDAVLIGRQGDHEISTYDLAESCNSIPVEILGRLGERVERIYV